MNTDELRPPHDHAAEQALLGCLLINEDMLAEVAATVTPDMFYRRQHADIYRTMLALRARLEPQDALVIAAETTGETQAVLAYLLELMNAPINSLNAGLYARTVADTATRRTLIALGGQLAKGAWDMESALDDVLAAAESGLVAARNGRAASPVMAAAQFAADYLDTLLQAVEDGRQTPRGVLTGLIDVDRLLIALQPPHQYILAGRPGMGKSALALKVTLNALRAGKRVLFFSLEMSREQVLNRLVALIARVPVPAIRQPWMLTDAQRAAVVSATGELSRLLLYIDDTPALTPADVHARSMRIWIEHGLDLIIVDHIHIMRPVKATGRRVEEVGEISQALAATYKLLNVPGLTLAQLNRAVESRAVRRPMLADLRDSGELEQNAYAVAFLYRPGAYDDTAPQGEAELIIAKHRDGETGTAALYWRGELMEYGNAATIDLNPGRDNGHYVAMELVR